jgi:UDP-glucose 4-epimerase
MVIPRFVSQALRNKPLSVYGDGTQTRTFTYVEDVVQALMGLIQADNAAGEVYNIGGTEEISMLDLAQKIITACGSSSEIELIPYEKAFGKDFEDMLRRVPSIDKINRLIGFEPRTSLDDIIERVIAYVRETPNEH